MVLIAFRLANSGPHARLSGPLEQISRQRGEERGQALLVPNRPLLESAAAELTAFPALASSSCSWHCSPWLFSRKSIARAWAADELPSYSRTWSEGLSKVMREKMGLSGPCE